MKNVKLNKQIHFHSKLHKKVRFVFVFVVSNLKVLVAYLVSSPSLMICEVHLSQAV
jgi:hypothetical protein